MPWVRCCCCSSIGFDSPRAALMAGAAAPFGSADEDVSSSSSWSLQRRLRLWLWQAQSPWRPARVPSYPWLARPPLASRVASVTATSRPPLVSTNTTATGAISTARAPAWPLRGCRSSRRQRGLQLALLEGAARRPRRNNTGISGGCWLADSNHEKVRTFNFLRSLVVRAF